MWLICEFIVNHNVYKEPSEEQRASAKEDVRIYFLSISLFCSLNTRHTDTSYTLFIVVFLSSSLKHRERMVPHLTAHTALLRHKALLQSYLCLLSPVKGALTLHRLQAFY